MTLAFIGIGANLGDGRQALKDAIVCLAQHAGITVLAKSSFYRTAPVDATGDDYFNAVVKLQTTFSAPQLLRICHHIEDQFGRERPFRNAPRTLDLDLLLYGDASINTEILTVPHPRMTERAFVLVPLLELSPAIEIPGAGRAADYLAGVQNQRIEKISSCKCTRLQEGGTPA
ncbi:MAG: 2-amino-4-hydroxy-6-hydroxymethyldihydropteridine diphosphokinase [Cupriavidus sp.]|jgi:2-amino-4-hydroxy-6-hydroxymethyldihydropteridine diphosphokinase|uniref:2-amino-4-hydroxy-6- hydroxymethyldihydropteridine diphosphokinase n=1 Tax=Cupriavidus pauculus TaxID=82633 RepID=UPI00078355C0|nr:2-amino-4-hydroxy-6-hydroxymethyldihydropteridine diphosphokinase [Cupriavidus pauculus]MBU65109.1 2-amino-4-hydroxy-6-hydroxymethyldihydropteridine diphosphokinase [Cupriavidus sp.]KAB0604248.1 2-amino-4-hydroxy-6-hydroxymethyldihydropteridine diphosphokinase [Cupriavidus pauculus]MBY4734040.1 2-amino-4-hydroxy-6-hydroxymethyldihydropteridine diphosphokinase [Cupriavidus pauculus]MCM3606624.1 2-amino-4-hydroxy-6-hydroxymethyldihydropteridine diphosphokinase [Cupriavidus pauculus]UAL00708.1